MYVVSATDCYFDVVLVIWDSLTVFLQCLYAMQESEESASNLDEDQTIRTDGICVRQ